MLFVESLLGTQVGSVPTTVSTIGTNALIWLSGDTVASLADGTTVTTWTNLGVGGASYNVSASVSIPTKTTFGGKPAIRFNTTNQVSYNLVTPVTLTGGNCTLVLVTKQSALRVVALGGKTPNGSCFWGNSSNTGSAYLYRNTADTGWSPTTLASVAGHKVFCAQITGTTSVTYFDNSITPVSVSAPLTGTFIFGKVGARDYSGNNSQPSDGYIAEIMVFTSIVPVSTCQTLVDALKAKYGV